MTPKWIAARLLSLIHGRESGNKVAFQVHREIIRTWSCNGRWMPLPIMPAMATQVTYSEYGVPEDGRDDKSGTTKAPFEEYYRLHEFVFPIGIEIVHVGGQGAYPEAQLEAIDGLIAYIDAYLRQRKKFNRPQNVAFWQL